MSKHAVFENYISLRREVNLALGERLRKSQFGHKQMLILYYLSRGSISMRELAEFTLSDPAAISRAVASLEKDGYVVRKTDSDDQRKVLVSLTAKGRTKARKADAIREDLATSVDDTLSAREREQLASLIGKVVRGLRSQTKDRES